MYSKLVLYLKFPPKQQIFAVYSMIVIPIYTWSLLWFFHNTPAWLYYLSISEWLSVYSYVATSNFLESLVVLIAILGINFFLPSKLFLDRFLYRGATLSIFVVGYMMFFSIQFNGMDDYPARLVQFSPLFLMALFLLVYIFEYIPYFSRIIEFISEKMIVLMCFYVLVSIISILSILVRMEL